MKELLDVIKSPEIRKAILKAEAMTEEEREAQRAQWEAESRARLQEEHQRQVISTLIKKSGIGEKFLKRTFETFDITPQNEKAYAYFKRYAEEFENQKKGIFLYGAFGVGKTHLAAAVANHLMRQRKKVVFLPVNRLKERVYASYQDYSTAEIIAEYLRPDLLILDDFDKVSGTEHMRELLFGLFDRLYEAEKKVIITANRSRTEIGEIYGGGIASRIAEMCHCAELKGEDLRLKL